MKSLLFIPLGICLATSVCHAAPKVLLAQTDTAKIARVKAGTLQTANASWWGFDKADATDCLQNAINSGVSKLIVDNTGSDWIINKPLKLVSNQTIVFADGVVIVAKEDCFYGKNDSLFEGANLTNLTMQGEGNAILRMRKADYQDPAKYTRAEWRMGIKLSNCSNVTIRNFTVTQTGGDGLYLGASPTGANKNVLVEDMNFDANHRLGMAVISVDGLTIRRTKFVNTLGTGPNGGIDFEPNYAGQQLKNILLEDCEFANNIKGSGVDISPAASTGDTLPISITFKRCLFKGNAVGISTNPTRANTVTPVTGTVTLIDCLFDHNRIRLRDPVQNSIDFLFQNCTLDFSAIDGDDEASWDSTPITLICKNPPEGYAIGGVTFDRSVVISDEDAPIEVLFQGPGNLSDDISGTLLVKKQGKTTAFNLAGFIEQRQQQFRKINAQKPATVNLNTLQPPATGAERQGNKTLYLQGAFTFLQYATKGQQVTINVTVRKVYPRETTVELIDPSGNVVETYDLPLTNQPFPITFTAAETGLYRVVRKSTFSQRVDITSASPGNGLLAEDQLRLLPLAGKLYFQVPAGVKEFNIGVASDTTADVALINAQGTEVERHKNLKSMQLFTGTRADASKSEIWSIDVSRSVWVLFVQMYAPLVPVVSTNPDTMLLLNEPR